MKRWLPITARDSRDTAFNVPVRRAGFRREHKPRPQRVPRRPRAEVSLTQQVRLEFFHPQARQVQLAGSFNDWRPRATWMISLGSGRWVKELLLPPGRYEYCFVVDGVWLPDPRAEESTRRADGRVTSILVVPPSDGQGHGRRRVVPPQRRDRPRRRASRP